MPADPVFFQVEDRERVRRFVLELAHIDPRVTAGAVVGSLALSDGDRWSDLDLTFAVADQHPQMQVLEDWTLRLAAEFGAVKLFDLPSGTSIYRVFLLPGCLQFDLSFTPASSFGASGPKFRLLFGEAVSKPFPPPPVPDELFGYAVHHLLRARFCIERGRFWQAEYWISSARDCALHLACHRRGLPAVQGRGFDQLPEEVLAQFYGALVGGLTRAGLLKALEITRLGLLAEAGQAQELADASAPILVDLGIEFQN